jgi:ubiquitin-protein ligase
LKRKTYLRALNERISDCGANVVRPRWSGVVEMEGSDLAKWISGELDSCHTGDFFRVLLLNFSSVYPSVAPKIF